MMHNRPLIMSKIIIGGFAFLWCHTFTWQVRVMKSRSISCLEAVIIISISTFNRFEVYLISAVVLFSLRLLLPLYSLSYKANRHAQKQLINNSVLKWKYSRNVREKYFMSKDTEFPFVNVISVYFADSIKVNDAAKLWQFCTFWVPENEGTRVFVHYVWNDC